MNSSLFSDILLYTVMAAMTAACCFYLLRPVLRSDEIDDKPARPSGSLNFLPVLLIPAAALGLYLLIGNPSLPDHPLQQRLSVPPEELPLPGLITMLEARLKENPDDVEGWQMLARARTAQGAPERAADAWRRVIEIGGENNQALIELAVLLIDMENGVVGKPAKQLVERVLSRDPDNIMAIFLNGLSMAQEGLTAEALRDWQKLLSQADSGSRWAAFLNAHIADYQ